MARLDSSLEKSTGLRAVSIGYPSRKLSVSEAAAVVSAKAAEACGGVGRPAFAVTFSLGGAVVRHAASLRSTDGKYSGPDWRGSVLLAPPNRGSDLARALLHSPSTPGFIRKLFLLVYGPAVLDLALSPEAIAEAWPDAPRPCGIIAGTAPRSLNPASLLLAALVFGGRGKSKGDDDDETRVAPRTHDGTVAVDETCLPNPADDFATVHAGHTFIAESRETAELVASFLTKGRFF